VIQDASLKPATTANTRTAGTPTLAPTPTSGRTSVLRDLGTTVTTIARAIDRPRPGSNP
jgi:hypothetical protein